MFHTDTLNCSTFEGRPDSAEVRVYFLLVYIPFLSHNATHQGMRLYGATNPPTQRLATVYVNVNGVQNSFTSSTYLGKPTVKMWGM